MRRWYVILCLCANCKSKRQEKFNYGQVADTSRVVCKTCGIKGQSSAFSPVQREKKPKVVLGDAV